MDDHKARVNTNVTSLSKKLLEVGCYVVVVLIPYMRRTYIFPATLPSWSCRPLSNPDGSGFNGFMQEDCVVQEFSRENFTWETKHLPHIAGMDTAVRVLP
eukprot:9471327-Pyramimonas_sp.AAC.1